MPQRSRHILPTIALAIATIALFLFANQPSPAAAQGTEAPVITGLRLGQQPNGMRFVIDASAPLQAKTFSLSQPNRLVIDLPETRFDVPKETGRSGMGFVSGFRFGQFSTGLSRLVLDIDQPAKIARTFTLPGQDGDKGSRLVIDIEPITAAEFAATAGWPKEQRPAAAPDQTDTKQAAAAGPRPNARPAPYRKPVVVLDAGHGGIDPGAHGRRTGMQEKDIVLDVVLRIRNSLEKRGLVHAKTTRSTDVFIPLKERVRLGRALGGDLFVSVHADSAANPEAHGAGVYTLSENASDAEAATLAHQENRADIIAGVDLSNESNEVSSILIDLTQRETMNSSVRFATMLAPELGRVTHLRSNTHRFAGFRVLKGPDVPSVLVELGFLTNAQEEKLLASPDARQKMADAIARAIELYLADESTIAAR